MTKGKPHKCCSGVEVSAGWLCLAFSAARISALHLNSLHLAKLFSRKSTLKNKIILLKNVRQERHVLMPGFI